MEALLAEICALLSDIRDGQREANRLLKRLAQDAEPIVFRTELNARPRTDADDAFDALTADVREEANRVERAFQS